MWLMKKKTHSEHSSVFLRAFDIPVIVLAAVLTFAAGIAVYSKDTASSHVTIRCTNKTWIYPLASEEQLLVSGLIGETKVIISGGRARIVSSPCGGQTCVAAAPIL